MLKQARKTIYIISFLWTIFLSGQNICTNYSVTPGTTISASGAGTIYNTTINVPDSYTLTDVNVTVDITHTYNDDLDIFLISPLGTIVELSTDNGGSANDYDNVTFNDASGNTLPPGTSLISGDYQPEGSLATFNTENSSGNWVLRIIDDANADGGTINTLSLNLCYAAPVSGPDGYLGPGGVGHTDGTSNLVAWYYPHNMRNSTNVLPSSAETVNSWLDASGYNNTVTNSGTAVYTDGTINGYSALTATALNRQFVTSNSITAKTILAVNNPGGRNNFESVVGFNGDKGIRRPNGTDNIWQSPGVEANNDTWSTNTGFSYINGSSANTGTHGNTLHFVSQTRPTTFTNTFYLGGFYPGRTFTGSISEVIMFNVDLNLAQKIIIDNYLSAKYNITISANDFYTQDTSGENFDHKVAGIGQASDGSNHTDSQGTGIIRINTPSDLNNDEFLFWGEDVKEASYDFSSSLTTGYMERLETKWRVSKRNDLGTVSVFFNASDITLNSSDGCNNLKLIVSSSSTFATKTTYDLVLSSGVYTATAVSFSDNDYFTIEYQDLIVLDTATAYNGSGTSNKPNTDDDCYKLLVKSNTLTLSEDGDVREIEVEPSSILAIDSGIRLQVTNGINNSGDIRLVGTSQLVQTHTSTANLNTGSGNLYVDQSANTSTVYQSGYWSSPVSATVGSTFSINGVLKDGSVPTAATATAGEAVDIDFISGHDGSSASSPIEISTRWLATFNNASDWTRFVSPTSAALSPGLGWNMKSVGSTFTFKGTPNDGEYSFSIAQDNYSLLGNPFPSAIDAEAFITQNSSEFNGELYIYNSASDNTHVRGSYTGTYSTIVSGVSVGAGRYLPIGQAFFVTRTAAGSGTLTFRNSQRTLLNLSDTDGIVGRVKKERNEVKHNNILPVLKIGFEFDLSDTEKRTRQVAVAFRGLTNNFEQGFDAEMWGLQPTDMYLKVNDRESPFIITGIASFSNEIEIPLVVRIDAGRTVSFSLDETKNIDSSVYLLDKLSNTFYEISKEDSKSLYLEAGEYKDRFYIVFKETTLGIEENILSNSFLISHNREKKELLIKNNSKTDVKKVTIYNLLGQKMIEVTDVVQLDKKEVLINTTSLTNSMYIVTIESENGIISKKFY